jgi:predicted RNase H-like HicB family nuclease
MKPAYAVIYEKTGTGYSAYAPDLPGCITTGATREETERLMVEAMEFHIAGMREEGEAIPESTTLAAMVTVGANADLPEEKTKTRPQHASRKKNQQSADSHSISLPRVSSRRMVRC